MAANKRVNVFEEDRYAFINCKEEERLRDIHANSFSYRRSLEKRKEKFDEAVERYIMSKAEDENFMPKTNYDNVRTSPTNEKKDPVADYVIAKETAKELKQLLEDSTNDENKEQVDEQTEEDNSEDLLEKLLYVDVEHMSAPIQAYVYLRRSLLLYERMMDLYTDDISEVLWLRYEKGLSQEKIAEELSVSKGSVGEKVTKSNSQLKTKIEEILDVYYFNELLEKRKANEQKG